MGRIIASVVIGAFVAWMAYVFTGLYIVHLFGAEAANGMIGALAGMGAALFFGGAAGGLVYRDLERTSARLEASRLEAEALAEARNKQRR